MLSSDAIQPRILRSGPLTIQKVSQVRWAPATLERMGRSVFATATFDCSSPCISMWSFDPLSNSDTNDAIASVTSNSNVSVSTSNEATIHQLSSTDISSRSGITGIEFTQNGSMLVTSTEDGYLHIFRIDSRDEFKLIPMSETQAHTRHASYLAGCTALDISRSGGDHCQIASVGSDGQVVFSTIDGRIQHTIAKVDSQTLTNVQWRTPFQVVTTSLSGRICLIDQRADKPALVFADHGAVLQSHHSLAVHPTQSEMLVTGTESGIVQLWDLRNVSSPESSDTKNHKSIVWDLQISSNDIGKVWSCSEDGSICAWTSMASRDLAQKGIGHTGFAIGFSGEESVKYRPNTIRLGLNSLSVHSQTGAIVSAGDAGNIVYWSP
ncbi:hypothetical protein MT418_007002 [Batrachochytrium dendrobatidis]